MTSAATAATAAAVINIAAIPGVTAPVTGGVPGTTIIATSQYTVTVTWAPAHTTFAGETVYTATITLTAKTGYTLTGVAANFFTVTGAVATNPIYSGVVTAVFPATATVAVGESYGGGIVFYILVNGDTGYDSDVQHGLIAAKTNQGGIGTVWSNITDTSIGTTGTAIGDGRANTTTIVGQDGCTDGAAKLCHNLTEGGYDDWFLPSKDELNNLYLNRVAIGNFATNWYWSSSEDNAINAWGQYFGDVVNQLSFVKTYNVRVRAVRAF